MRLRQRLLAGLAASLVLTSNVMAQRAETLPTTAPATQGVATVQALDGGGFGRLVFTFDGDPPDSEAHISNGVLVIAFSSPVMTTIDKIATLLPDYVGGARRDQDGKAVRLVLSQRVKVNTMEAGRRLFIDLLPATWTAAAPGLPKDILDELNNKAREALRLEQEAAERRKNSKPRPIEIRAATLPTFSRLTFDIGLVAHVGRLEQILADLRRRRRRHLLDPDDERKARTLRRNRVEPLVHRGRAGGAGILDPGRSLEAQIGRGLQHQRRGEILRREARVEMAEHDLVDFARPNAGIHQRLARDPHDQAFDRLTLKLPEAGVRPSDDAGGHGHPASLPGSVGQLNDDTRVHSLQS